MKKIIFILVITIILSGCSNIERYQSVDGKGSMYHLNYRATPSQAIEYITKQFPNYIKVTKCRETYDYYIYCEE